MNQPLTETTAVAEPTRSPGLNLHITDVTATHDTEVTVPEHTPAGQFAQAMAERLELPTNVPWALRDDRGMFLDDHREIGEQAAPNARLVLTPKTHLG